MNILCIAAHPDDEILGAGATLARHVANGDDVYVLFLSTGVMSRYDRRTDKAESEIAQRQTNARSACNVIGVDIIEFGKFPDNQFDTVPLLDIIQSVELHIEDIAPDIIYTHHYGDLNIDHELTCRATMTATRQLPEAGIDRILAFEILSSSEWAVPSSENSFQPTVFVDVSQTSEQKIRAMKEYDGEIEHKTHPRTPANVERNMRLWGAKAGTTAAEAFELLKEVR